MLFFFFFSSRRRHTIWNCDWSSDVCSSDLEVRAGWAFGGAGARIEASFGPIGGGVVRSGRGLEIGRAPLSLALAVALAGLLEQRIALELVVDIGGEIQIGELQQLDGLHQLRRHHQRVALPKFESLRERHVIRVKWSVSCLSGLRAAVYPYPRLSLMGVNSYQGSARHQRVRHTNRVATT